MKLKVAEETLQVLLRYISKVVLLQLMLFVLVGCAVNGESIASQLEFAESQNNVESESSYKLTESSDICENDDAQINMNRSDIAWNYLMEYCLVISEPENRNFDISYPVEVEGENCYKIILTGKLMDGGTYLIDTFAVNINNYTQGLYDSCECYYYDNKTEQFEELNGGKKIYYSITSPNGEYRFENAGLANRSVSGVGFDEFQIIDLTTGECTGVMNDSYYAVYGEIWSEDSRFVAFELQWIWDSDIVIVDTVDFSRTFLDSDEISSILPNDSKYEINSADEHYYAIDTWVDSSILQIKFHCFTGREEFHGKYQYDAINKIVKNVMIEKEDDN